MQKTIMLGLLLTLGASCGNNSGPTSTTTDPRILYELREKCGRDAHEWFKREYASGGHWGPQEGDNESNDYSNHYNLHLNRCYAVARTLSVPLDGRHESVVGKRLVDVNENKQVGGYAKHSTDAKPDSCQVADQECGSEAEWETLAESYMGK